VTRARVSTPHGEGEVESIYITQLGYIMVKISIKSIGMRLNFRVCDIDELLKGTEIKILEIR